VFQDVEPRFEKTRVVPITVDNVGHGRTPNGDAYKYVAHESARMKCGYVQPNTTNATPGAAQTAEASWIGALGRPTVVATSTAARIANTVPLNGLSASQAERLTEKSGTTSSRPTRRTDGRQPERSVASNAPSRM
jgi:hypothetical protein